jgi:hypothetical protein
MKKVIIWKHAAVAAVMLLAAAPSGALAQQKCDNTPRISLEQIESMFAQIKTGTDWNMEGPMLWSYFFTDDSKEPLDKAIPAFEKLGYRIVDLRQDGDWWLHVEQEETLSPESLYLRNLSLYQFANDHKIRCYDGMDVGPVKATPAEIPAK